MISFIFYEYIKCDKMVLLNLFLLISFSLKVSATDTANLVAVVQIFRHGQRIPNGFYSTDPYSDLDTYWGGLSLGQLTNVGKRQLYELGQFSRKRYSGWLPAAYSKKDIYIQSTDLDRNHMSAQCYLYGLYTATGSQVWRKNVNWQPIPVHPFDPYVAYANYECPLYTNLLANITSDKEFVNLDRTYADVYECISNNTNTVVTSFTRARDIYDPVHTEEELGFTLPSWLSAIYPEPLTTLTAKAFEMSTYTTPMKRLHCGILLNNIFQYFEKMVEDPTFSQKYQIYCAHDTNIFAILNSVGQTPTEPLPSAVSVWFELRKVNFVNVVQMWMKSRDNFTQLSINGCDLNCPLTEVKSLLKDILSDLDTHAAECIGST